MKLLIFSWLREYTLDDILYTLDKSNISYDIIKFDVSKIDKSDSKELFDFINKSIIDRKNSNYSALFSVNYFPDIAKACYENNLLYISWSYDCPLDIRNVENTISLPTNRAFFFDKLQAEDYMNENNTVFHFPLAVNADKRKNIKFDKKFASEISFVGSVYSSSFPTLTRYLDDYYVGYLNAIMEAQKKLYGSYISREALDEDFLQKINENFKSHNCPFTQNGKAVLLNQLSYSIATQATFENRLMCLGLLSSRFDLKWYTTRDAEVLPNIKKCPPVDYLTEMQQVFFSSKINLHIGLHAISSGISLRQLDIMSCGGFLLSSFQPELFDYFIPGEDFDYFSSPEECLEKCSFYLSNEDLRSKIAASGREKVSKMFNYDVMLQKLFETAFQ